MAHTCTWGPTVLILFPHQKPDLTLSRLRCGRLWAFRGGVSTHTQQEGWGCRQNRVEPFGRSMAFTAVNWPLGGLRGLGGLRRRGGRVLLLIDLLHLRPLAVTLLLPVCSTVDEIRMVKDHRHMLPLVLAYTIWLYWASTDSNHKGPFETAGRRPSPSCLLHCGWNSCTVL